MTADTRRCDLCFVVIPRGDSSTAVTLDPWVAADLLETTEPLLVRNWVPNHDVTVTVQVCVHCAQEPDLGLASEVTLPH